MVLKYQRIKGTNDILPGESELWDYLRARVAEIYGKYAYERIDAPVFETTELFSRAVGEVTDIVQKEMYTFSDQGERSLTLRPEGTAGVARAYIENNLEGPGGVSKLWYWGPMFRAERPQKGRYRQFHQFGSECYGSASPLMDVEVMLMNLALLKMIGIPGDAIALKINSIGSTESRARYLDVLKNYFSENAGKLSPEEQERASRNPLRLLDSKNPDIAELLNNAPKVLDYLDEPSRAHWNAVCEGLDKNSVAYEIDARLVRGLDYYTHTVFEFHATGLGAQSAIGGGGRYDKLVEELGGKPTPAVGAAFGIERVMLVRESLNLNWNAETPTVFVALLDAALMKNYLPIIDDLRTRGFRVATDYECRSLKSQMRQADKCGAFATVIIGQTEHDSGMLNIHNMKTNKNISTSLCSLPGELALIKESLYKS